MRRMIVVVLGLAVVLVGVDFAARAAAEATVARQLRSAQGLPVQPEVTVDGFPFLLQAAEGRYRRVDVRLRQVPAAGVRLDEVDARLSGVQLPLSALFGSGPRSVPVDGAQVTGKVSYPTLGSVVSAAVPPEVATVEFADGGGGRLRATVHYTGPGGPLTGTGTARLSIDRGRLTVQVAEDTLARIPAAVRSSLAPLLARTVQLPRLPLGLVPTSIAITGDGVGVVTDAQRTDLLAG